jgi:hypothetical protein
LLEKVDHERVSESSLASSESRAPHIAAPQDPSISSKMQKMMPNIFSATKHKTKITITMAQRLTIRLPDDFHHHVRDGKVTEDILKHAVRRFGRCLCMPNIKPPVITTELALEYKDRIVKSLPEDAPSTFQPLVTLYLTDKTGPEEIQKASQLKNKDGTPTIIACKYYPAGATTNSDFGVTDVKNLYPVLEEMQKVGMMLCIHSEVTHADIFEREPVFIEEIMKPLVKDFPTLKMTMEHISTREAVEYVLSAPDNVKASITCHHLIYNRNRTYELRFGLYLCISQTHRSHFSFIYSLYNIYRLVGGWYSPTLVLSADFERRRTPCSLGSRSNVREPQILFRN